MYWFLLRPRWVAFLGLCLLLSATFVSLGFWQLDRLQQRRQVNATLAAARDAQPRPVESALSTSARPATEAAYTQIRAIGSYDAAHEYLVRSRTVDGRPGLYVLTPLVTTDGTVIFVVRGWVAPHPRGADVAPDVPAAPQGEVTVVGRIRLPEDGGERAVQIGDRAEVTRINVARLGRETGRPVYQAYVELVRQEPPADPDLVLIPAPDDLDEGPHLSYAVQWFTFATLVFVGYGIHAWRHAHPEDLRPGATTVRTPPEPEPAARELAAREEVTG